jgi:hypothetical protein
VRAQALGQQAAAGAVAFEGAVRGNASVCAFAEYLLQGFAEGQRLGLREEVRHQQVVLAVAAAGVWGERVERLAKTDEVTRHQRRALVQQLVERVLAVGSGLAPHNG